MITYISFFRTYEFETRSALFSRQISMKILQVIITCVQPF